MSEMTPEKAAELRKAFPENVIGKLPKGGAMLDFVGHAAVTDRLLIVDPEWTWEPMGLDEQGLPATDKAGNLWIRLTILGVTRIGVGDGKSAKEAIGDALRNAAMRFGVALDLWSKNELEQGHSEPVKANGMAPVVSVPPLAAAKARAWAVMRKLHPEFSEDEAKASTEGELQALGSSIANADTATWVALSEELEARYDRP